MTIIKKCKDCKHFMIDCSFSKVDKNFHAMEDFITCKHFKPKNETNADRIRSMTDEEMADRLTATAKWPTIRNSIVRVKRNLQKSSASCLVWKRALKIITNNCIKFSFCMNI